MRIARRLNALQWLLFGAPQSRRLFPKWFMGRIQGLQMHLTERLRPLPRLLKWRRAKGTLASVYPCCAPGFWLGSVSSSGAKDVEL
jgi:hypothetical protein